MAKVEGTQSIPAEWLDEYRAALTEKQPDNVVRKRYPYRVPKMQSNKGRPHAAQVAQRARFKTAISDFKSIGASDRARWYDSMPVWGSFLWYYNYFILSSLMGNANIDQGGTGVIKSIQNVKEEVPTTGTKSFTITTVDPDKTVVMMYGNSYISDKVQRGANTVNNNSTVNIAL